MASKVFGGDFTYVPGQVVKGAIGRSVYVYSDEACTTLAEIFTYPGNTPITGSVLTVDSNTRTPYYYGPADGTDKLFERVDGIGPINPVFARVDDRLDALEAGSGSAWAAADAAHLGDLVAAHAASAVGFTPAAGLAATTVQAAIEEVVSDVSGTYVATAGLASGVDDLAALQALLTAARVAGGGVVKGLPGQAYKISAPLVIGSDTTLDMTDCSVSLTVGAANNMIRNYGFTAVRAVADGAMTSGSANLDSATAVWTDADIGRSVYVAGADVGGYQLTGTILSRTSATRVVLNKAAGTTVAAQAVSVFARDHDIEIKGGTWDRGAEHGATGREAHSMRLRHVDRLTFRDIKARNTDLVAVAGKYFINPGDCTDVLVEDCDAYLNSTLVQPDGPITRMTVRNITGSCGDDMVAFVAQDWPQSMDTNGDMVDIAVENIRPTTCLTTVKIMGGPAAGCKRVDVDGVYGSTDAGSQGVVWIGDDTGMPETIGGVLEGITLRNLKATPPDGVPMVLVNGIAVRDVTVDGLYINNVNATTAPVNLSPGSAATIGSFVLRNVRAPALQAGALVNVTATATITRLVVEDVICAATLASKLVNVAAGGTVTQMALRSIAFASTLQQTFLAYIAGTVGRLTLHNVDHTATVAGSATVHVIGTITDLKLDDVRTALTSTYAVTLSGAPAVVSKLTATHFHCVGGNGLVSAITSGQTLTAVEVAASYFDGSARYMDLGTTTEVHLTSVGARNLGNEAFFLRATGIVILRGDGNTNITASITAGGALSSRSFGIGIDVSKLTKAQNHMATNTNAGLSCGAGPVVGNATPLWQHILTGATY